MAFTRSVDQYVRSPQPDLPESQIKYLQQELRKVEATIRTVRDAIVNFSNAPVTKTGSFTVADTDNWIICNGTGTITVTLPSASLWTGRDLVIKTIAAQAVNSASSNVVPLASATAGTAILANTAGKWARLVSDGTNWVIMAAN